MFISTVNVTSNIYVLYIYIYLFGVLHRFQQLQVITRRVVGRAEETSTYSLSHASVRGQILSILCESFQVTVRLSTSQHTTACQVRYCKLPTNGKQLPAFPLEVVPGTEARPQRWEVRVLPLCHHGPLYIYIKFLFNVHQCSVGPRWQSGNTLASHL